jgi:hypothetical protein
MKIWSKARGAKASFPNDRSPRVFVEDFAAKLPTAPQLTVYASYLKNL